MQIEIKNTEADYLEFLMYNTTLSPSDSKKRRRRRILVPIIYIIFGLLFYASFNKFVGAAFFIFSILWALFYPKFIEWKYTKAYKKFIQESYEKRLNKKVQFQFNADFIHTKDESSESKIKITEVDRIVELQNLMLIYISKTSALVIPKRHLVSSTLFKGFFSKLNIQIFDKIHYKWS